MREDVEIAIGFSEIAKREGRLFSGVESARAWLITAAPDWRDNWSHQFIDNIAEALAKLCPPSEFMPTSSIVAGDTIRWTESVFDGGYRKPRFLGKRTITATVEKERELYSSLP